MRTLAVLSELACRCEAPPLSVCRRSPPFFSRAAERDRKLSRSPAPAVVALPLSSPLVRTEGLSAEAKSADEADGARRTAAETRTR